MSWKQSGCKRETFASIHSSLILVQMFLCDLHHPGLLTHAHTHSNTLKWLPWGVAACCDYHVYTCTLFLVCYLCTLSFYCDWCCWGHTRACTHTHAHANRSFLASNLVILSARLLTHRRPQWWRWGGWINPLVYHSQHVVLFIGSLWGNSNRLRSSSGFLLLDPKRLGTFLFPASYFWLYFLGYLSPILPPSLLIKDCSNILLKNMK